MQEQLKYLPESRLLLDIANKEGPYQLDNINPAKLLELAERHDIAALVFNKLKEYKPDLPADIYAELKSRYLSNLAKNQWFWNAFLKINQQFRQANISFVPIKGMDTLIRAYPGLDLRSLEDIDLMIKEDKFDPAQDLLCRMGYQKKLDGLKESYWKQKQCHIKFYKEPLVIEIHWGLDFKRGRTVILPRLWQRTKEITIGSNRIMILSAEDAFFAFALHLRRFGDIFGLKQVLDVAGIINGAAGFNWDYVLEESHGGRMRSTVYFILKQAQLFTKANIPDYVFEKLGLSQRQARRIERIIIKCTFQAPASLKDNYLKAHFLLYDDIKEPVAYLINIPYEQFCKFYDLAPYTRRADFVYSLRWFYSPLRFLLK